MSRVPAITFVCAALLSALSCTRPAGNPRYTRRFTDMIGKTLQVPQTVHKAFSTSPMGTTLSYTFDPDLLLGWNYALNEADAALIPPQHRRLPVLGGWFGKTAGANVESLMAKRPDVILSVTTTPDGFAQDHSSLLGEKTGVPVVTFTLYGIQDTPRIYDAMGTLSGNAPRAATLGTHARRLIERARAIASRVSAKDRVRVYYAEGVKGLNTEPAGSMHAELIEFCGGVNVANVEENNISGYGNTPVSLEQVVVWNPDIILVSDYLGKDGGASGWRRVFADNPLWQRVKAVRDGRVYVVPRSPFQWIDRPPSVNRLAGAIWLPKLFYPELCDYDLRADIREFYSTFYHSQLSEEALDRLLDTTVRL